MARYGRLLTDAQWEKIRPWLPKRPRRPRGGRPPANDRKVLEDSANALLLAEELGEQIRNAEQEWKKIDKDLLKIIGGAAVTGILAAGPLIAGGYANFLAAAVAVAGAGSLLDSTLKRRSFPDRFPAAFFMKVDENN